MLRMCGLAACLACAMAWAQTDTAELLGDKLLDQIGNIDSAMEGVLGVAAIDLSTGNALEYHGNAVFPQASVIKIPIMIEAFRSGKLAERIPLDRREAKPGGDLYAALQRGPITLTVKELVEHMIQSSDNTAAN